MKKIGISSLFYALFLMFGSSQAKAENTNSVVKPNTDNGVQFAGGCAFKDGVDRAQQMQDMKQAMKNYWM